MRTLVPTVSVIFGLALGVAFSQEEPPAEAKAEVKKPVKLEGDNYKFGEILFNSKTREIRFPAEIIQNEVILEYALVQAITGKVHESLLATEIRPVDLQIVMKLLRYKASKRDIFPEYDEEGEVAKPMGDDGKGRVEFLITTKDKDGKSKTFPLSDWVERRDYEDVDKRTPMVAKSFAYTGSDIYEGVYIAEAEGGFAAIYRYSGAMFNAFQELSDNDDVWFPKEGVVPPIGTKVEVTIKPPAGCESH